MIIAMGFFLFGVAVKYLPIFPRGKARSGAAPRYQGRTFGWHTGVDPCGRLSPIRHALRRKRLTYSISTKLIASLLAGMLIIFALLGYLNIRLHRQHLEAATLANAERVSDRHPPQHSILHAAQRSRGTLPRRFEPSLTTTGVIKVRILNQEGRDQLFDRTDRSQPPGRQES